METDRLAHGFGGVHDLPIPLWLAISAAVGALILSFVILALTTRPEGTPKPVRDWTIPSVRRIVDSRGWLIGWRLVGVLLAAYTAYTAIHSPDLATNPLFGIFYVLMWVGVVFASLLFGEVWKAISPVRAVASVLYAARGTREPILRYPARLGMWPATLGLLAFTWLELVYPNNDFQAPVRTWLIVYVVVMIIGGQIWGTDFYENCDPFEVYSSLMARLSPWARVDGRLVLRRPLANLDATAPAWSGRGPVDPVRHDRLRRVPRVGPLVQVHPVLRLEHRASGPGHLGERRRTHRFPARDRAVLRSRHHVHRRRGRTPP